ncbi:uncharacterized protein Fot_13354 [Forsythia ovata]|uniref:BAH domain-containing protein n=1 Tax=Forsythia ovata TaxID=205694 RepID=A0ABD1W3C3_9LAMI
MSDRRLPPVASSDDDDEDHVSLASLCLAGDKNQRKGKELCLDDEEKSKVEENESELEAESENEEPKKAQPIGEVVRVSGGGEWRRNHYDSFVFDGKIYNLEDSVLLEPQEINQKPRVAILKDITQNRNRAMMVTIKWFYRPQEAEKRGGVNWESRDSRNLFYSFHRDEVPAEFVMHKCVVHFISTSRFQSENKIPVSSCRKYMILNRRGCLS